MVLVGVSSRPLLAEGAYLLLQLVEDELIRESAGIILTRVNPQAFFWGAVHTCVIPSLIFEHIDTPYFHSTAALKNFQ